MDAKSRLVVALTGAVLLAEAKDVAVDPGSKDSPYFSLASPVPAWNRGAFALDAMSVDRLLTFPVYRPAEDEPRVEASDREVAVLDDDGPAATTGTGRPLGRPKKSDPPRIDYNELDRLLVFGEVVPTEDGSSATVVFPGVRELARRFDVSPSVISEYAKRHNCRRRRETAALRVQAQSDNKLVELRANALALSRDDTLRIVDASILEFEKAFVEGRVRFDSLNDFATIVKLRELLHGGADSRQEIHAALSLEDLQARHRKMLEVVENTSADERGEVERPVRVLPPAREGAQAPPTFFGTPTVEANTVRQVEVAHGQKPNGADAPRGTAVDFANSLENTPYWPPDETPSADGEATEPDNRIEDTQILETETPEEAPYGPREDTDVDA